MRHGCGSSPLRSGAVEPRASTTLIKPLRDMGHIGPAFGGCADNLNQTPLPPLFNLGSTSSFGIDLSDFDLLGGAKGPVAGRGDRRGRRS